jgi:hypothetical protein
MTLRLVSPLVSRLVELLVLALVLVVASSADAKKIKTSKPAVLASAISPGMTAPCRGSNMFHCGPLYNGNDYLGNDPDSFIRMMIQRDLGAKYGGDP